MSLGILNRNKDGSPVPEPAARPREADTGVPVFRPAGNRPPNASVHPDSATPALVPEPIDLRTLVVGRGIHLKGTVADAERLVVEGTVDATMEATELMVTSGGTFRGEITVDVAHVAGRFEGSITARKRLVIRETGIVTGTARCHRLSVEEGGQLTAQMEMLGEAPARRAFHPEPAIEAGD
ncbi:polymer-forming cytoskeletal protein [Belnapia sp. F-4-1]|uniref:bactofilin family protein n=1 Tax=Belnapia sp. F-4-1 TaxID=1545443 RepID=UPI00068D2B22|nr:polymer-forming cytoskeletal protein [Belnapia sp. F-4-1]